MAILLGVASRLSRITPGEVVELPEGVGGENKIPDGERAEINDHPDDVRPGMRGNNDKHTWKTQNQGEQHQGNSLDWSDDGGND